MSGATPERTREVLEQVFAERQSQDAVYGEENVDRPGGSGPDCCWLLPYTGASADEIQEAVRTDYEDYEDETGQVTWVHLVREEVAEAFQEETPERLAAELIQVAALCVAWVEGLPVSFPLPDESEAQPALG